MDARLLVPALVFAALLIMPSAASAAYTFGDDVTALGPQQMIFDYSAESRCGGDPYYFEDAPARAIRDASGRIQLIMSNAGAPDSPQGHTRRLIAGGGSLVNPPFTADCTVIYSGGVSSDPGSFDNWGWLVSPYTDDGQTIYGLVHNEYHGWEYPGQCTTQNAFDVKCWYNTVTLSKSTDRGNSYSRTPSTPAQAALIASVPYTYVPDSGPEGYFQPGNIIKKDGWYYTLFRAPQNYQAQAVGSCLIRTQTLNDPKSWLAYDGNPSDDSQQGFTINFVDPYHDTGFVASQHVCAPVSPSTLGTMSADLVYSRYFNRYIVVDEGVRTINGQQTSGVFYSLSSDLINWETPRLLMKAPLSYLRTCSDPDLGIRDPALIDSSSTDRNFGTIGQTPDLYFVQSHFGGPPNCPETLDRDLVRIPISFTRKPDGDRLATLEGGGLIDSSTGYDWTSSGSGTIYRDSTTAYDGSQSAHLISPGTTSGPYGGYTVGWPNGSDVWYGSAFFLQPGFATVNNTVTLMRWLNSPTDTSPSRYGGVVLGTNDTYQLIRGKYGGPEDSLASSFTLPEGRWFWLEVHQKLQSDATKGPLSEVFVDGRLVATSAAPNAYPDSDGMPIRVHIGYAQRSTSVGSTTMWIDRSSLSGNERGALGAPPTPTGLTGTEQDGLVTIWWLASPGAAGYRVYRQSLTDGTWSLHWDTGTTGEWENGLSDCTRYHYRVAAYDSQGRESIVSEPLELMPRSSSGC